MRRLDHLQAVNGVPLGSVMRDVAGPNWMLRDWGRLGGLTDILAEGHEAGVLECVVVAGSNLYWIVPAPGKSIEDAIAYLRARATEVTLTRGFDEAAMSRLTRGVTSP